MTKQYSPRTFLRQVPNDLLKEFFERRQLLTDMFWYLQRETEVDLIFERWQALPHSDRIAVERAFLDIHDMATEDGVRALVEEGQFHGLNLAAELEACDGHYHKAMYAFLRYAQVFYVASQFNYVESVLSNRFWETNTSVPRKAPAVTPDALAAFAGAISEFYKAREGRGHHCTVETYLRCGRDHYFFAYPDNYTETYIGHAPDGQLIRRPQRGAFEVIFVYCPEEGTLDIFAKGGRAIRSELQSLFCAFILQEKCGPQPAATPVYELDGLLGRDFQFPTDPEDRILEVRIRRLRFSPGSGRQGRITVDVDAKAPPEAIYDLLAAFMIPDLGRPGVVRITQASFDIQFIPVNGAPTKKMSFDVSVPDSCTLKNLRDEQRLLGEKYLKRWGIFRG